MIADTNVFEFVVTTNQIVILIIMLAIYIFVKWLTERATQHKNAIHHRTIEAKYNQIKQDSDARLAEREKRWTEERIIKKQIEADLLLRLAREGRIHLTDTELAEAARQAT
jgi:hypothetical protein